MYKIIENGCWQWEGKTRSSGRYGYLNIGNKTVSAHRHYCEIANGKPSVGFVACHKCGNSLCVNPEHLYWGTMRQNYLDSKEKMDTRGLCHGWGRKGFENQRCKLTEKAYTQRIKEAKKLRGCGYSYRQIMEALGLKSKGHARQICLS
jgi:hypothetical protein